MTVPSIKEALEHYAHEYCEGWCEQDAGCANFDDCGGCLARRALATLQPDGERREAIALQIWNDRLKRRGETTVTMETVRSAKERGFDILAMDRPTADAILASGLVQDEAGIRRDEREKCAEIADLRYEPVATEIAAAIRSARDGGAS